MPLPYRLGLDLGTNSIGWSMVRLDKSGQPCAIIRSGVRIFSDGRVPKSGESLAVTRRIARQARRRRDRLLKRKAQLIDALIKYGLFPKKLEERKALANLNPYELRKRGLDHPLTPHELGRALFHLNQRRGFKSNRKTDKKDNESGLIRRSINELRNTLQEENCRTVGEWLAKRHERGESVRARLRGSTQKDKGYDFYVDRSMIEEEFDLLWEAQRHFSPEILTDDAYNAIKDIIFYQRPLKPVKPGRCTLLPENDVLPSPFPAPRSSGFFRNSTTSESSMKSSTNALSVKKSETGSPKSLKSETPHSAP